MQLNTGRFNSSQNRISCSVTVCRPSMTVRVAVDVCGVVGGALSLNNVQTMARQNDKER